MSGSTNVDYREAFVLQMEMNAHGPYCKKCVLSALHGKPENACDRMRHMRENVKRAYEALPPYYKNRFETAMKSAFESNQEAIKEATRGR